MIFSAINWTPNEQIGERKMDQMTDNAEWLYKFSPRAIYTLPGGLRRTEGVKIASGRVLITKRNSDSASAEVRFGNFFSSGCEPNITTGVVSVGQAKIFCVTNGIGTLLPDSRGFQVGVNIAADVKKRDKIMNSFYVTWSAMGY